MSLKMQLFVENENGACRLCTRPDEDEEHMVRCDDCDRWFHLGCAKLTAVPTDSEPFLCIKCKIRQPKPSTPKATIDNKQSWVSELVDALKSMKGEANSGTLETLLRRETMQSLPVFDGKTRDWPLFKKTLEETTKQGSFSDLENLSRLQRCLRGEAEKCVKALMLDPKNVDAIKHRLEETFGRPELVYRELVRDVIKVRVDHPSKIPELADAIDNLVTNVTVLDCTSYLNDPRLIDDLVNKLPLSYQLKWIEHVTGPVTLIEFNKWLGLHARNIRRLSKPANREHVMVHDDESEQSLRYKAPKNKRRLECPEYKENPADAATKISNNESLWIGGPSFLTKDEADWPKKRTDLINEEEIVNCHFEQDKIIDIDRYSDWMRLVRHLIILRKFTEYLRNKSAFKYIVKISDVEAVKNYLFKRAQREGFPDEMERLEENEAVKPKSSIRTLAPYLDENGVLRCNSRLKNVECLPSSARMPIILPQKNRITKLIVRDCHENCLHQADNVVVSMLRQEYWIINMRAVLNNVKRCCQWCILHSCKPAAPLMANIPEFRVQPHTPPFLHTGVDYFGPFEVAVRRSTEKRWGVIFVCMSTRAVHLEVAPKLDTDSFLVCLKNFQHRKGKISHLYSDNGTNFVGAERELRQLVEEINQRMGKDAAVEYQLEWHFNPPSAPHFGGIWERQIQTIKKGLRQMMEDWKLRKPSPEKLTATLLQIEFILNSRPRTHIPLSSEEEEVLTPFHFTIGRNGGAVSPWALTTSSIDKQHFKAVQHNAKLFWDKWKKEYLPTLLKRDKWTNKAVPIKEGDVVVLADDNAPPGSWLKGRVITVHQAKDGQVRSVEIKTVKGVLIRPAVKVAIIDVKDKEHLLTVKKRKNIMSKNIVKRTKQTNGQ